MIGKLGKNWQDPARSTIAGMVGTGVVNTIGYLGSMWWESVTEDAEEEEEWEEDCEEVYSKGGPDKLARYILKHDDVEDLEEAEELVEEFEDDHPRVVRRYEKLAAKDDDDEDDDDDVSPARRRKRRRNNRSARATNGPDLDVS